MPDKQFEPGQRVLVEMIVDEQGFLKGNRGYCGSSSTSTERVHPIPALVWVAREAKENTYLTVWREKPFLDEYGEWDGYPDAPMLVDPKDFVRFYGPDALPAPGTCEPGYLMWVPKRVIDVEEG